MNTSGKTKNIFSTIVPVSITSVIFIDDVNKTVNLYYKENDGKGKHVCVIEPLSYAITDDNFTNALSNVLKIHFTKKAFGKTALILSDSLFFTDTIKLPVIQKKAMSASLGFAFNTIYPNYKELKYISYPLFKDKKKVIYNIVGIRKEILEKVTSTLNSVGVDVASITFASNSSVDRAISFNPKIKNADCILVDVKEFYTRFSLVVDGKAVAFYTLPFGYSRLSDKEVYREESFFDHSSTELLVINANEKAKNKKLTTYDSSSDALGMENFFKNIIGDEEQTEKVFVNNSESIKNEGDDSEEASSSEIIDVIEDEETVAVPSQGKVNSKTFKRLPKYMVRPEPETAEGVLYENFRPIIKWALELIKSNQEIFVTGTPKTVFVNIPAKFYSVFTFVAKEDDAKVSFVPLTPPDEESEEETMLELYGGLYVAKRNKFNLF